MRRVAALAALLAALPYAGGSSYLTDGSTVVVVRSTATAETTTAAVYVEEVCVGAVLGCTAAGLRTSSVFQTTAKGAGAYPFNQEPLTLPFPNAANVAPGLLSLSSDGCWATLLGFAVPDTPGTAPWPSMTLGRVTNDSIVLTSDVLQPIVGD
jgi:hypothetical protein